MIEINMKVSTKATYLREQSSDKNQRFLWSYEITIHNNSDKVIQLLNRHWRITDLTGRVEEIRGPGVIGLQPIIKPGKAFTYNSFCQLPTPQGTMEGDYEMQTLEEEHFIITIPKFALITMHDMPAEFRAKLH